MERIKEEVAGRLAAFVRRHFDVEIDPPAFLYPPSPDLGDLAVPLAFDLAKRLKKPPRAIASDLASCLAGTPGLQRAEVAGAGYVNLFLDRPAYALLLLQELRAPATPAPGGKVIVEHTNINPNKAAHIGHLRNAVLGDTLARSLKALGHRVEVQNYIDDTGVQVADLADRDDPPGEARPGGGPPPGSRPGGGGEASGPLLLGPLRAGHGDVREGGRRLRRRGEEPPGNLEGRGPPGDGGRDLGAGPDRRPSRRGDRPLPPLHHGSDFGDLRPPPQGKPHPCPPVLGEGVPAAEGLRRGVPPRRAGRTRAAG